MNLRSSPSSHHPQTWRHLMISFARVHKHNNDKGLSAADWLCLPLIESRDVCDPRSVLNQYWLWLTIAQDIITQISKWGIIQFHKNSVELGNLTKITSKVESRYLVVIFSFFNSNRCSWMMTRLNVTYVTLRVNNSIQFSNSLCNLFQIKMDLKNPLTYITEMLLTWISTDDRQFDTWEIRPGNK